MGNSNESWGDLVAHDPGLAEAWDSYARLPEPGSNEVLDRFCATKRITIPSLVRLGARLSDDYVLAFAGATGIKYRDIVTGRRWSFAGSTWDDLKIVPASSPANVVIVCEGETDGARLTEAYPQADVAILQAGARTWMPSYADQLASYELVLVGTDTDEAGEKGAKRIVERLPQAIRFAPPENDWCSTPDDELPELLDRSAVLPVLVDVGTLLELEEPDIASWYESALLPVGGLMVVHGAAKSFKTFVTLDLLARLAQAEPWAGFEPTEEPCKVAVIQYELTWPYYRQRVLQLIERAEHPDMLRQNFLTWSPLARPQLVAGNTEQEDHVVGHLLRAGVQVVLLDPIRRATGSADLNAEADVRKMLGFFERLNDEGITVVATHHDSKQASRARGGDPLGMTGSGAWTGDPDTIVSIELPGGQDARSSTRRNLHFTLRNAPAVGGRAFAVSENGNIQYDKNLWDSDEDPTAPSI